MLSGRRAHPLGHSSSRTKDLLTVSDDSRDGTGWEDLFGPSDSQESPPTPASPASPATDPGAQPMSRREARQAQSGRSTMARAPKSGTTTTVTDAARTAPRPKRRRLWIPVVVIIVVMLGLAAGAAAYVWLNYEDQVRAVLGWELPPEDYEGEGSGEASFVIETGDDGYTITQKLVEADIIKGFDAFYDLLLAADPPIPFYPGYYVLSQQMSAQAALDALQDPANRVENVALIHEGRSIDQTFEILSLATEIPIEDFEAAAVDPTVFGAPAEAPSLEGYLFPATYRFDPGVDAESVIRTLVDRTFESLDTAGVAPEDRHRVLTMASLIQREAGSKAEDFFKVSRVIQNRLDQGMLLQFDSTSHYGYAWAHGQRLDGGVFSNSEELNDPNPYNTYVHTGLPIGPIGAAGDLAIDAAVNPVDGPWLYFVTVNLDTGETTFSETLAQHNAAVRELQQWCRASQSPNCQ